MDGLILPVGLTLIEGRYRRSEIYQWVCLCISKWRNCLAVQETNHIALSSTATEYVAVALMTKDEIWIKEMLEELKLFKVLTLELNCDNWSCINLVWNPKISNNIWHVSFKRNFLRDLIEDKKIELKFTPSTLMWASFLANPVSNQKHILC